MVASIEKSSTQGFRKQKNKIVVRHSLKADMIPVIPDEGEVVFATDTNELIIGNGIDKIQDLSPISGSGGIPSQTGHAGEFLTTDGTDMTWSDLPQADWDQSDSTAPDYIKNKPYIPEGVVIDQTYDPTSTNGQSGTAVAEAVGAVNTALTTHTSNTSNPHQVTKDQVGLGNVDNTSDADKPVSTAMQTALDNKVTKNVAITGATKCKITYDEKGLVTAGADLQAGDIPDISATYQTKLSATNKLSTDYISGLSTVATSGDYGDLLNKPTIPAAQVNSDWNSTTGVTEILNKPTLSLVATSGDYNDLLNKPYIPAGVVVDQTYNSSSTNPQSGTAVAEAVSGKIDANTAITGGTKCKITYDSKGLVTAGADLSASDIPSLTLSKISDVTASSAEINKLTGLQTTAAELGYVHGVTSDIQTQISGKQAELVSGSNIKTINNQSILGSGDLVIDSLPSQTSQSGKFLTTDGTDASWANIPTEIPTQAGNSGKFLTTDGSAVSWATVDALPSQASQSGKFLTTNGTTASWADIPTEIPSQTGQNGKYLTTDGSSLSWNLLATVATSGSYTDLSNTPSIPTVNDATITITQGGVTKGSFTLNQSSANTIALDDNVGASVTLRDWSV